MTILLYSVPAYNPREMNVRMDRYQEQKVQHLAEQGAVSRFFSRFDDSRDRRDAYYAAKHEAQSRSFQLDKVEHYLLGLQDARVATNAGYIPSGGKGADSRKVKIELRPDLESEVIDAIKERMGRTYFASPFTEDSERTS